MPMVKETRTLFDTGDILQLRLVCKYRDEDEHPCRGEILYQFGARKIQPDWRCPKCGGEWQKTFPSNMPLEMRQVSPQEAASFALLQALETLAGPGCGPFTVRFEIDGEPETKSG